MGQDALFLSLVTLTLILIHTTVYMRIAETTALLFRDLLSSF
jgi:hypothetical protein